MYIENILDHKFIPDASHTTLNMVIVGGTRRYSRNIQQIFKYY